LSTKKIIYLFKYTKIFLQN